MKKYKIISVVVLFIILAAYSSELLSKGKGFKILNPDDISRYSEERIVYQRIEEKRDPVQDDFAGNNSILMDNSVESLLVIKDRKIHFIVDGYDSIADVRKNKIIQDSLNKYIQDNDNWVNKINGKPDLVRVIYRRSDLMTNTNETFVNEKFGAFFKSVRDRFVKLHTDKFRLLLRNRGESGLIVDKRLLSYKINPQNTSEITQKFFISARAKSNDGTVYYCEDSDGDGITETFSATRDDGFDWGLGSGPNLLNIMFNSDKDLEAIIGKLAIEAAYGTVEEENKMLQEFPTEKNVQNLMDQLTPMDRFYE